MSETKTHVLLIEDNVDDQQFVERLLAKTRPGRFVVTLAESLAKGINALENDNFDVVICDLNLPDSEGINTVTYLQDINHNVPIVVLSENDDEDLAIQSVQLGAQDYLVKGQGDGALLCRVIDYSIERKKNIQSLSYLVNYDNLTGLANRFLFKERLDRALIRADRNKTLVALLVIDLDRFKNINDTLGHDAGDQLLVMVAKRIKHCTREGDTIARLGGDEFTVIMEDVGSFEDAVIIADKILSLMKNPFELHSHEIYVSPSIGISMYPLDDLDSGHLLKNADSAMYRAKADGRNCYRFYTSDMNSQLMLKINMESRLRRAIEKEEFVLHYQPKFNIETRELIGAEALIRWLDPKEGMISPGVFIPLAEETGLIGSITDWVIKEACKQNSFWQLQGYESIRMSINLSPRQFNQENIAKRIINQIICSDLAPKYVELEITEGALMENIKESNEILNALKKRGIHISIDDFGTGYSSLSYLKKIHLDTLKIDQSFVHDLLDDPDDTAIVSAIIAMAKSLRLNVIAEGVETEKQLEFLASHGCNEAQGYLLGKPVPAEEFVRFFKKQPNVPSIRLVHSA